MVKLVNIICLTSVVHFFTAYHLYNNPVARTKKAKLLREPAPQKVSRKELARLIDHTLLRPETSRDEIEQVCKEAIEFNFMAVCIPPFYTSLASNILKDSGIKVCTVVGFPFGYNEHNVKSFEAARMIKMGADELDMVINITALKSRDLISVCRDIEGVVNAAEGRKVKIIIETCYLNDEEKITACKCAVESGAAFVKTSTGFGARGATTEDVRLMRTTVPKDIGVKAAGGIRDLKMALEMIEAGAERIGTSAGVKIVSGL